MPGVKTNEREGTRAVLRHSRMSASKVRQVLNLIRGQDVDKAAEILSLGDREAAVTVGKVLASAVANAAHNDFQNPDELYVSACYADEGTTAKRWRPRARGRATRIRKRTSHITIIVSRLPEDRIARRRAKQAANTSQRSRRVAGSRRRQQAESGTTTTTTEPVVDDQDTGSEAWDEEATHADDLVTETEAGPLEESDFEGDEVTDEDDYDGADEDGDEDGAEIADEATAEVADDVTDEDAEAETDEDEDNVEANVEDEDTDGDSAEEKGK